MRFLLLISFLFLVTACEWGSTEVARVGKFTISKDDYKQFLVKRYGHKESYAEIPQKDKQDIINQMVVRKLKLNEAYALGMESNESILMEYEKRKSQMIGNLYFERNVVDDFFPESVIREEFERTRNEVKASHVLIAYKGAQSSKSTRSKEEAIALAMEISERAKEGVETLALQAQKYSDDLSSRGKGGDLGYFTWGRMVPAFQKVAFDQKIGEISDPVHTPFGYHVIQTMDIRKNARFNEADYPRSQMNIKRRLYQSIQDSAMKIWEVHFEKLKEDHAFTIAEAQIDALVEANKKRQDNNDLRLDSFSEEEKASDLFTWDGGSFKFKELLFYYTPQFGRLNVRLVDKPQLVKDVTQMAGSKLIMQAGEKAGLHKDAQIAGQLENFLEMSMLKELEKIEVTDKVSLEEDTLRAYFEKNKAEYVIPEQIELWEIYVTNEKKAKELTKSLKAGKLKFEETAKKYSEDKAFARKNGYLGYKAFNGRANVAKEAFAAGKNKIVGPIKYRQGWAIIKTGKIKPQRQRTFEMTRNQIKNKLRNDGVKERKNLWEADLRQKYTVEINDKVIAEM